MSDVVPDSLCSPGEIADGIALRLIDGKGRDYCAHPHLDTDHTSEKIVSLGLLNAALHTTWNATDARLQIAVTIHNPRRARHRGGYWDLGDPGAILVDDFSVEIPIASPASATSEHRMIGWVEQPDGSPHYTNRSLSIYQESSGGTNWLSRNHVNRDGIVPMKHRGYRAISDNAVRNGERASPIVAIIHGARYVACVLQEFWQQFPNAIEVNESVIRVRLWPAQFPDYHELQAGEQNTRVVVLQFGNCDVRPWTSLKDALEPIAPLIDERSFATQASRTPFLLATQCTKREDAQLLFRDALEGNSNFFAKRETIDEYGWRNYGDTWADHEGEYCAEPAPVISHYNNQYDLLYGLLAQYIQTADQRWWRLADPLARHVLDIDVYTTQRDKPAYNNGMFWHTNHYLSAGRCTHRSYSHDMVGKRLPAGGGGPANEHIYSTGLLLYFELTGDIRARACVISLADWVIAMDDGSQHILGVLSNVPTGLASNTALADYHGPGRGAGNSINTLIDAWIASGKTEYLSKAIELIERTVHPCDDLAARQLDNAELRWSYTVYLHALFRFLEVTTEHSGWDAIREYARQSLLHYAKWIDHRETFYLDQPDDLEFPTETWAAQDMRKGTALLMAAVYSDGADRDRLRSRGFEFLDGAWMRLMTFETRCRTRPLAVSLQQSCVESYLLERLDGNHKTVPFSAEPFGGRGGFIHQKAAIKRDVRTVRGLMSLIPRLLNPKRWRACVRQLWLAERLRQLAGR